MAGAAAAVAVFVQAAVLTTIVVQDNAGSGPTLANYDNGGPQLAAIRFSPNASAADITRFLDANKAIVINGPKRGALYDVRLSDKRLSQDELTQKIQTMKAETRIVEFIAPKD
jgi:hypothetical protein